MTRFNSINFYQNRPKVKLFLTKNYKSFERWGLRPQTPNCLRRLGALPPGPIQSLLSPIADARLHALKCNEKIGLKLKLGNCVKTKLF